jgi:hypothetical protein
MTDVPPELPSESPELGAESPELLAGLDAPSPAGSETPAAGKL